MTPYATVADVRSELKAVGAADDPLVLRHLFAASHRLDALFFQNRSLFAPYREARRVPLEPQRVSSAWNVLYTSQPLLELISLSVSGHTVALTGVELWPPPPAIATGLRLLDPSVSWWHYAPDASGLRQATITAIWGYHSRGMAAWERIDALAANINASATTLTVSDVDGEDANGLTPRIAAGSLLRVDDEYMLALRANPTTNGVMVRRGVNGTTATAHTAGAPVDVWQPEEVVRRAVTRLAALLYAKRGAFEGVSLTDGARWDFPPDLAAELRGIAQGFAYV